MAGGARRELVEESGLTSFHFDEEPLSLDEHAVEFCSDRGTVHHLDVRFLATAEPDAADGRRLLVALTAEGAEWVRRLAPHAHAITAETLSPLAPEERQALLSLLLRLR